ncbi:MAG: hypothetical protein CMF27_03355 [Kiritimatiellaceae bacterium]|jgi:hypothetical protein|nr:hypothetical protein [Kiritimatiellaceae bacterium]
MEIKTIETIGRLGLPITEVYNQAGTKIYEAHDDLPCEFWSQPLLETIEQHIPLQPGDVEPIAAILREAWTTWGNLDDENRIYHPEKFHQFVQNFRQQEIEDQYLIIQEIVALLGKGVNRYGEKMRAMKDLLDEKWDELMLFQGRGKPNLNTLQKGKEYLSTALAAYCESKGIHLDQAAGKKAFEAIFEAALEEEHMAVFKQI